MELVLDANIIFAALIKESHARHIILTSGWSFYIPEFLFDEVRNNLNFLIKKTELPKEELKLLLSEFFIRASIIPIPLPEFEKNMKEAEEICPDPKDVQYFALALKFNIPIWSNEKILKKQDKVKVLNTNEIYKIMSLK